MRNALSQLIRRLTVGRKLALIYFLDLTAVIFVSAILINEKFIAIDFAEKEVTGNAYIEVVRQVLVPAALAESAGRESAGVPEARRLARLLDDAERQFGAQLGTRSLSVNLSTLLLGKAGADGGLLEAGRALITRIGNQSNLILDPDLDSYYTMSLIVLRFPEMLELLNDTRRLAAELATVPPVRRQDWRTRMLILEGRLDAIVKGIDSDYEEAFAASDPLLRDKLAGSRDTLREAVGRFRDVNVALVQAEPGAVDPARTDIAHRAVVTALDAAWGAAQGEMGRLLHNRIDKSFSRMWLHLGTALLLLAVILCLVFFVAKQIALPIRRLAGVADDVRRTGNYQYRAEWDGQDEIGRLVAGFNDMLAQLDRQRIVQQELAARSRAAEAQRQLVEAVPIPLIVTSIPEHEVLHANDAAQSWTSGQTKDPWRSGMASGARARFFQQLSDLGKVDDFEVRWSVGGTSAWALVSARRIEYQGRPAVLTAFTPIGRMKSLETRLEIWAKVFEASSEGIVLMSPTGDILSVNAAFRRSTGYEDEELLGKQTGFLLAQANARHLFEDIARTVLMKGSWQGEALIKGKYRGSYPAWLVVNVVRDARGTPTHFIALSLDISERKETEQRIHYMAHHDALTGLPNRLLFESRLQLSIQQARRSGASLAVLFIDLDRFKNINDSLGHHVGDGLLCSVAARLLEAVREGDTVCRLGGDEFVVLLNNVAQAEEVARIAEQRLVQAIRRPHQVEGNDLYVSCSVGIAMYPADGAEIGQLMRNADSAMYEAKHLGRNNAQFFVPQLNERVVRHLHLETELRHAAARGELELHFQPRIDVRSGRVAGVECLLRWNHPTEGLMMPGQFISIAEESGLIVPIGAWVIREACRQHREWIAKGYGAIPVSVNISGVQLRKDDLVQSLQCAFDEYQVSPGAIELEITESILMDDVEATIDTLGRVKALGVSLSIDDFGTGYSSLNYLYRFPLDKLKIDRSFVQDMHDDSDKLAVTRAIIALGHTLGLQVVAEGVESEQDVTLLSSAGCDELQGYHIARPMPPAGFEAWLVDSRRGSDRREAARVS